VVGRGGGEKGNAGTEFVEDRREITRNDWSDAFVENFTLRSFGHPRRMPSG
jgi:hypothetical protein